FDTIQGFFSIPLTNPFNLGANFFYKRTVAESHGAGFHVGGGFGMADTNLGTGASFSLHLTAIVGLHLEIPGVEHVTIHLDGGPAYNLVNTSPITTTGFQVSALSPALGASV